VLGALTATRIGAADAVPSHEEIMGRLDQQLQYLLDL
jgi:hypothetical protein